MTTGERTFAPLQPLTPTKDKLSNFSRFLRACVDDGAAACGVVLVKVPEEL